ncbi:hypothetical protein CC80DRAFT_498995 [Byssothecium circinans]|uniref:G domain-containing protein n=1 Tax=Byssothecium circinans TaxID=147558 RepID=A0A6A5UBV6_9PLEO|nr:hypothetical protein CC80DRAFT_498995 [Byssothecium circinans]
MRNSLKDGSSAMMSSPLDKTGEPAQKKPCLGLEDAQQYLDKSSEDNPEQMFEGAPQQGLPQDLNGPKQEDLQQIPEALVQKDPPQILEAPDQENLPQNELTQREGQLVPNPVLPFLGPSVVTAKNKRTSIMQEVKQYPAGDTYQGHKTKLLLTDATEQEQPTENIGHHIAFIGETGAGKSSTLNALLGHERLATCI